MGVLSKKIQRDELKPGDHIYSWRFFIYAHHGIYIGNGKVIHFRNELGLGSFSSSSPSNTCPRCGVQSNGAGVYSTCLECFLSGGDLYRFEYGVSFAHAFIQVRGGTCSRHPCDPAQDVLQRAQDLLTKGFGAYNLLTNNCEDFAFYCKTQIIRLFSGQVADYVLPRILRKIRG